MRLAKVFPAVIILIILLSSPSSAIDPFAANEGGFGPKIAGTQLGMKMTLMDIIRWRMNLRGLPFTLEINSERIPGRTPSGAGSISILFKGKGKELSDFEVSSASREFYRYRQEKMRLQDLIGELENAYIETITLRGKNTRVRENCITFTEDMRVASIKIRRNDWGGYDES
ncbi:MAG: hypothetical protein IJ697_08530 [Synergistaceae bacterium]|nr:hypothetical protein [Synergistaceae bacterium]